MVRRLDIAFAACALSVAAQAAPVVNSETKQTHISQSSEWIQVLPLPDLESRAASQPSPAARTEYWIDEFDNIVSYTPPQSSIHHRRKSVSSADSTQQSHETSRSEQESLTTSETRVLEESTGDAFYRAQIAGYTDLMSSFGSNLDLDQEYINGFSTGVAILVFVVLAIIVMYLAALPMFTAVWRRATPRDLGQERSTEKHLMRG